MAATLVLLLAMSILLPSGAEKGAQDLVWLEVDYGTSDKDLSSTLQDLMNIRKILLVKELGTSKLAMVLREPDLAKLALKDVHEVLPVELFEDTTEKESLSWPSHPDISNSNLTLYKIFPGFKGQTFQQFRAELKQDIRNCGHILKNIPHRIYSSKGYMPPRYYVFINGLEDIAKICKDFVDIDGRKGIFEIEASYIQILHLAN
ncbi:hypothetical protein C0Q70_15734 [Pomacea canaliculata]|uniref:Uncharacterized protein n=2 Tax=Pomacea canaliculata TaxID=400727 RepID=A0A2T7NVQ8_POMCA|nr:uncharacterized protein LOC112571990 isoform X2 [Pomacea canaliculata]PVD25236.1 hypothetical protein C0Q70_15734 [Pomacea canaliculata]